MVVREEEIDMGTHMETELLGYTDISLPPDDRVIQSRIADMSEVENFDEYIRSFFQDYEEELFD